MLPSLEDDLVNERKFSGRAPAYGRVRAILDSHCSAFVCGDYMILPAVVRHIGTKILQERVGHPGEEVHTLMHKCFYESSNFNHS